MDSPVTTETRWRRRARPLLGTLVDIGVAVDDGGDAGADRAIALAFAAIEQVQAALSPFDDDSDLRAFARLPEGGWLPMRADTARVLHAAQALQRASGGAFDLSLGSGAQGWACRGHRLHKLAPGVALDASGLAKGHAVDRAAQALRRAGLGAGWVNAGGDLRVFGPLALPLHLRDEHGGGVRAAGTLEDGAFATSHFGGSARARLHGACPPAAGAHVSVAAPRCLWADALTKVVAVTGDSRHPLLARLGAQAWCH